MAPLRRACEQLALKVRSEEEDLQRLADIWSSYRPTDGRPSSLRAGALRDFRKQSVPPPILVRDVASDARRYFRKVVADSEERIPRYKKTISVSIPPSSKFRSFGSMLIHQELRRAVDSMQNVDDVPSPQGEFAQPVDVILPS